MGLVAGAVACAVAGLGHVALAEFKPPTSCCSWAAVVETWAWSGFGVAAVARGSSFAAVLFASGQGQWSTITGTVLPWGWSDLAGSGSAGVGRSGHRASWSRRFGLAGPGLVGLSLGLLLLTRACPSFPARTHAC